MNTEKLDSAIGNPNFTPRKVADLVRVNNVYLATFMATMGCKPVKKTKGPEVTVNGDPITYWIYDNNDTVAKQLFLHWNRTSDNAPAWQSWSIKEKQMVIDCMSAFVTNLRWFLADVKNKELK